MSTQLSTAQEAPPAIEPVAGLFNAMLRNGLRSTLAEVQQGVALLPEEVRQRAWHLLSYALRTGEAWPETRDLLLLLAPKMEQAGFREEWIAYLTAGVAVGQQHNDATAAAEFALQIAILYRMIAEYEQAVHWLAVSLDSFRQLGDRRGEARALNELAWVEQLRRRYADASQHVEQALALLDEDDPERGMSYRVQGMIASYRGEWEKAEAHHRAALATFERNGDTRKLAWSMQNLGLALRGQKQFDEAIMTFRNASSSMKDLGDLHHWATAYMNLGITYYFSGANNRAIDCYLEVELILNRLHDRLRIADLHVNLGLAHLANNAHENASNSFLSAIRLFDELGIQSMVVNSMDGLAMSYIAENKFDQAIHVLEDAIALL